MSGVIVRWWPPGVVLVAAALLWAGTRGVVASVVAVLLLGYAWALSPAFFPRDTDLQVALERVAEGRAPLVLWKPGCLYCILLRVRLGVAGRRVSWVDSSLDQRAMALVRSANGGDHTTPTVMFRDETRTNPEAAWVRSRIGRRS